MTIKKLIMRMFLIGPVLAILLGAGILVGCMSDNGSWRRIGCGSCQPELISH